MYLYLSTELDRTYWHKSIKKKKRTFFNKDFYEISDIKAYQLETPSQHSPSQNSTLCCTPGCLFTKGSLLIFSSSCHVCLHSQKMLWLYWQDGTEGPLNPPNGYKRKQFHRFGWFWIPTEKWKETAPQKRKFRLSIKVNIYLKPCIRLKSEMWILKMRAPRAKNVWIFWPPPKNPKFQNSNSSLTLAGGAHNLQPRHYCLIDWYRSDLLRTTWLFLSSYLYLDFTDNLSCGSCFSQVESHVPTAPLSGPKI